MGMNFNLGLHLKHISGDKVNQKSFVSGDIGLQIGFMTVREIYVHSV